MPQSLAATRADEVPAAAPSAAAVERRRCEIAAKPPRRQQERIQKLIRELGSPRYSARRAAASELRQIGPEAFDPLHAATEDADPEIAASANYLLRQIAVRWVQTDDPAAVRRLLRQYGQEAEAARLQRVEQLARLPQNGGVAALCRIARFDRSPRRLADRRAGDHSARRTPSHRGRPSMRRRRAAVGREHACRRHVAAPIPGAATRSGRFDRRSGSSSSTRNRPGSKRIGETSNEIVLGLEWNLAELYRQVGDQPAINAVLDRMMELGGRRRRTTRSSTCLTWLTENKSWDVLDTFLAKHQPRLQQSKRPLYYAALARAEQGKRDLAEQLADKCGRASNRNATLEGFATAKDLEEHGQFDWAVREYRRAIDKQPADSYETILARIYLANLLHDYEREKKRPTSLEPLVKAVQGEGHCRRALRRDSRSTTRGIVSCPNPRRLAARYHFYRACQYQAEKDLTRAKDEFDLAIKFDRPMPMC